MADLLSADWRNFSDGVITAAEPDLLPLTASPRGKNSALTRISPGTAVVGIRKGISVLNATAITGSPAIIGQIEFNYYASGAYTPYHLLVSSGGRLDYHDAETTTAVWDSGDATPFSSSTSPYYWPSFAIANNMAFICNGRSTENQKAYIESASRKVRPWGITRPTVGTMAGAVGAAGSHNGTYELRVTFRNTRTGHESSASDTASATVVATNDSIDWSNIPVSSDAQVDQRRLWVRNTATQANFYLAGTVDNNSGTTATTNVADTALVVVAPDTAENDPPATLSVCCWHQNRMFGFGPDNPNHLLYSKLGNPEAFDPDNYEYVNPQDGQRGIGLHSAHGILIIFKEESTWALIGDDPSSWELRLLFADTGCVSARTITTVNGLTYWWSEEGPMAWDGSAGTPRAIGRGLLAEAIDPTAHDDDLSGALAFADPENSRVLFALPGAAQTRNTLIRPFNYLLQRWDADTWEIIDIASAAPVTHTDGTAQIEIGSYSGQLFEWWDSYTDGVPSGTTTGMPTASTNTTLTDSGATFLTTGNGLIDRYVYVLSAAGVIQRRRITANTGTELTISSAWTVNPNTTYTYVVGGIDFQFDLSEHDFGQAFHRKRLRHFFLLTKVEAATTAYVDMFLNAATTPHRTWSVTLAPGGALYGSAVFGSSTYGSGRPATLRTRVGAVCRTARARIRQLAAGKDIQILKAALTAELLGDELGGGDAGTVV
jgi:hypothetical protein